MEESKELLFYIDQYIDNRFFSRSEPFLNRYDCISYYNQMALNNNQENLEYKLSVSLSLLDYDRLILKTKQKRVMFLDSGIEQPLEANKPSLAPSSAFSYPQGLSLENKSRESRDLRNEISNKSSKPVVVRSTNGYYFKNNECSRSFLEREGLNRYAKFNENKDRYFISDKKIERFNLDFIKYVNIKVGRSLVNCSISNKL